ncbi:MAG: heavy metal sensor histidine kinase, partial [Bryobacteraceae bacterium]
SAIEAEVLRGRGAGLSAQFYARLLDSAGKVLLETPGFDKQLSPNSFPAPLAVDVEPQRGTEAKSQGGRVMRILAANSVLPAGPGRAVGTRVIQVAIESAQEGLLLSAYRKRLWLVALWAFLASTLIGYHVARRGIRPIEEIAEKARNIRSTTLYERIETEGLPVELLTLAATFNDMLDRLEDSFARLSRFSADIAHELRTPVNNLRGQTEVALGRVRTPDEYREVMVSCLEECVRLTTTIDSLLFLARAEASAAQVAPSVVDVDKELATVRDYYEASAEEAGLALDLGPGTGIFAMADRHLFQRAVGNLVANSIAYTPAGGRVTLRVAEGEGFARIEVQDTGCGIPAADLPHIFDRFYRGERTRERAPSGAGLGLAIVRTIALLHGGDVEVRSEADKGTSIVLLFPTAKPLS